MFFCRFFVFFCKDILASGFDRHFSRYNYLKEFGTRKDIDKEGNVLEKLFLKFVASKLKSFKEQQVSVILTNQIHTPYSCPGLSQMASSKDKRSNCVAYLDSSLEEFFNLIKNEPWFKQTLFIFTADHISSLNEVKDTKVDFNGDYFRSHNVPLIAYHPTKDLQIIESDNISGHEDILPSIAHYLGLYKKPIKTNSFKSINSPDNHFFKSKVTHNNSLFSKKERLLVRRSDIDEFSLFVGSNMYGQLKCNADAFVFKLFTNNGDEIKDTSVIKKYEDYIKTYIQYYF